MNSLRGWMPWVFTRRHRTLHACRYRIFAAYASAENPSATDGRQGAGKHGGIFPRWADHLRTTLTDESVLVRPTDAQKPEPCSPVRSATAADRTPSEHWHPAIWEHACMVSDAFPSLAPVYRSDLKPWLLSLASSRATTISVLPPSAPSFPPPPHKRDDDHTRFTNILSVSYCLGVFIALPFNLRRAPNSAF